MEEYKNLSNKEKIELLNKTTDENKIWKIIRGFSSDELMLKYIDLLEDEVYKASVTFSMKKLENKIKVIEKLTDESCIVMAILELYDDKNKAEINEYKIKTLNKMKTQYYKNMIIRTIDVEDEKLIDSLKFLKSESDLANIIAITNNNKLKYKYLNKIKDEKNRSRIVISLDDENLKNKYIKKVKDKAIRTLLIASLNNKEKRDKLLGTKYSKYSSISIPTGMTIGMEIESEGKSSIDAYIIKDLFKGYDAKIDTSLEEGVEITTPILTNSSQDAKDIYCICKILQDLEQKTSERCGRTYTYWGRLFKN